MRGMFTAGVMDVLMENGIKFDGAIGVSADAAFGVNYETGNAVYHKYGEKLAELIKTMKTEIAEMKKQAKNA